jgi:sugar/nucleoside kinase (ribokinase family)
MSKDIVVCGLLTLDMLPDMSDLTVFNLIEAGKLFNIGEMAMSTGGAVSNTGIALHKLGIDVSLMGLIGDDWIGQVILDFLQQHDPKLRDSIQVVPSASSAYSIVLEPQNHDRTILTHTGVSEQFGLDRLDLDVIWQTSIVHLGYPTMLKRLYQDVGQELLNIFQSLKLDMECVTSLDMTLPDASQPSGQVDWELILSRILPYVDIFIPSIDEILFMLAREDYDQWQGDVANHMTTDFLQALARKLLGMGVGIVGFKLGHRGLYLQTSANDTRLDFLPEIGHDSKNWKDVTIWQPAYPVEVVGTTGAGDASYAGFLAGLKRGLSPIDCVRMACAVGACNVESADPTQGVRSWDETIQRLQNEWV